MVQITEPFSPTTNKRIGVAMLWFAGGLFVWMLTLILIQARFQAQALTAIGTVESLNPPVISFQTSANANVRFTQNLRTKSMPSRVSEKVLVAYLPDEPQRAEMVEYVWTAPKILAMFIVILSVLGYLTYTGRMVVGPLKQRRFIVGGE